LGIPEEKDLPNQPNVQHPTEEPRVLVPSTDKGIKSIITVSWIDRKVENLQVWAQGRLWYLYLPLAIWMGYIAIRTLQNADYRSFIEGLNLGIHETGHLLFFWAGSDLMAAGGTITQLAAPLITIWQFSRQKDYFAVAFALSWLGTNLTGIARYMADARQQILPMVSYAPGPASHDWAYLLSRMHILEQDTIIASVIRTCRNLILVVSALAGAYLVWEMFIQQFRKTGTP